MQLTNPDLRDELVAVVTIRQHPLNGYSDDPLGYSQTVTTLVQTSPGCWEEGACPADPASPTVNITAPLEDAFVEGIVAVSAVLRRSKRATSLDKLREFIYVSNRSVF